MVLASLSSKIGRSALSRRNTVFEHRSRRLRCLVACFPRSGKIGSLLVGRLSGMSGIILLQAARVSKTSTNGMRLIRVCVVLYLVPMNLTSVKHSAGAVSSTSKIQRFRRGYGQHPRTPFHVLSIPARCGDQAQWPNEYPQALRKLHQKIA